MKGIAHFASAVAVASFLPQVVERSAQGSLVLLFAGLGGLMPDVLDFRVARFLPRPDVEIDAGLTREAAGGLDAQLVAERLAAAIERAYHTGRRGYVRLGTVRLGVDLWQRYSVRVDEGRVRVHAGPLVDGSQTPIDGSPAAGSDLAREGHAAVAVPVWQGASLNGDTAVTVDVFSGTALEFRPDRERVEIVFLPWHRQWSHSLAVAALSGAAIALVAGPLAGLVYALGSLAHILEDQLGYMGSSLLYPFVRRRIGGLRLFHSGDALPNLLAVWLSALFLLVNLDRFSAAPVLRPWSVLALGGVVPWILIGGLWGWSRRARQGGQRVGDVLARVPAWRAATVVDVSQDGERAPAQDERVRAEDEPVGG